MNHFQESLVFAQVSSAPNSSALVFLIFNLVICLVGLLGVVATIQKAGKPAWAAFVPIYNIIVLLQIARKPTWWILLLLIPVVNLFVWAHVSFELARAFEKGTGFGWGLLLLGPLFYVILGFDDSTYDPTQIEQPTKRTSPAGSTDPKPETGSKGSPIATKRLQEFGLKIVNNYQNRRVNVGFGRQSQITDEIIPVLVGLNLHELYLSRTEITDESVEHFKAMEELQVLDVMYTNLSRDGIKQLKEAHPDAKIIG